MAVFKVNDPNKRAKKITETPTLTELFNRHPQLFITGTDTEVGKTYCSCLIVKHLAEEGVDVFPYKPISAGTEFDHELTQEVNEDAKSLYLACSKQYPLSTINPIVFKPAIAPHIAANMANTELNFDLLEQESEKIKGLGQAQLIEGAGGWLLPLNDKQLLSDWVAKQKWPVIMVVSIKLGCLNHALLTAQAIAQSGCELVGWIANFNHGETEIGRENLNFIKQKLQAPLLFEVQPNQRSIV